MEQWRGSGLGLTMVKLLVESMAGTIEVESELDQGSRFTIHLPMVIQ
jgi:signal transduction histidine kinase